MNGDFFPCEECIMWKEGPEGWGCTLPIEANVNLRETEMCAERRQHI
jgi:hypothetical protein